MEGFLPLAGLAFFMFMTIAVFVLAFLPTIVAWRRKHPDLVWIFITSFLGPLWILALVWAFRSDWLLKDLLHRYEPKN